jgi:hypothetical protein
MPARDEKTLVSVTAEAVCRQLQVDHISVADVTTEASAAMVEFVNSPDGPCKVGPFAPGDYLLESGRADLIALFIQTLPPVGLSLDIDLS